MSEHDEVRRCIYCRKDTPHTISGSGRKARCHECEFVFEYHDFYACSYDPDYLIDYDEFGARTVASRPLCDHCSNPIDPNETYAQNDKWEVALCAECFNNYACGAPIPFKKTDLMHVVASAIAANQTNREGE